MAADESHARQAAVQEAQTRTAQAAMRGARAAVAAILVNILLASIKILAGVVGNAYALIADGVESMFDVFSSAVVWGSLRAVATPPNRRYPYGYGRIEPLAALVVSIALLVAAIGIAVQSIREILTPHHSPAGFTLIVLVGVVVAKEFLFWRMSRAAAAIGSTAVQSDAWHQRSDAVTSLAAFVGISIARWGGEAYASADDWAELFACAIIAFNGVRIFRSAMNDILDAAPPAELEQQIRSIAAGVPGVRALDKCRIRKSGLGYYVDLQVVVDGQNSVRQGHDIAHQVKNALLEADLRILDVAIHVEPA